MHGMIDRFYGIEIIANPAIPEKQQKIKLSQKVDVSQEFREKCDKFYLDFFGEESTVYVMGGKMFANPRTVHALKVSV